MRSNLTVGLICLGMGLGLAGYGWLNGRDVLPIGFTAESYLNQKMSDLTGVSASDDVKVSTADIDAVPTPVPPGYEQQPSPAPSPVEPAPAPEPEPVPSPVEPTPAPKTAEYPDAPQLSRAFVSCAPNSGWAVRLRKNSNLSAPVLIAVPCGSIVEVDFNQVASGDGVSWVLVHFYGHTGWMASNLISAF